MRQAVSIIIPMYNEEMRIPKTIQIMNAWIDAHPSDEVLFSDDGSEDNTIEQIMNLRKHGQMRIMESGYNFGKWNAIRKAFFICKNPYVVLLDADLSVDPKYIDEYGALLEPNCLVLGNRYGKYKSNVPFARFILSRGFNLLERLIVGLRLPDTQCLIGDEELCVWCGGLVKVMKAKDIYCLKGDVFLLTAYGFEKIVNKFKGRTNEVIEVRASYGHKFIVTKNHPVLLYNGMFVNAQNIKIGDKLQIAERCNLFSSMRGLINFRKLCSRFDCCNVGNKFRLRSGKNLYPVRIELDEDFFYFLGLFQAEGTLDGERKRSIRFSFHQNEFGYLTFIKRYCDKIGGSYSVYWNKKEKCKTISVYHTPISLFFHELFSGGKNNKIIPDVVFNCKDSCRFAFVDGLFCGDGCFYAVGVRPHVSLSISSKNRYRIRLLLLSLGVRCDIVQEKRNNNKQANVRILSRDLRKFLSGCYFFKNNKAKKYSTLACSNWLPKPIRVIESTKRQYTGFVYGFETELSHTLLNDGVITHNSPFKMIERSPKMAQVFVELEERKFAGDVELIRRAQLKGAKMSSVDVKYDFKEGSTVLFKKHAWPMFKALWAIKKIR